MKGIGKLLIIGAMALLMAGCNKATAATETTETEKYSPEQITELKAKAEADDAEAQTSLGWCYAEGEGVKQDYKEAASLWEKATRQDYAPALYNLGLCYYEGKGVEQDQAEAVLLWQQAAKQGYAPAQYNLGVCFCYGKGIAQNKMEAVIWFTYAAEQGLAEAQLVMGVTGYVYTFKYYDDDYDISFEWISKAAKQGYVPAQFNLGINYYDANDHVEAVKWFTKAAEQGYAEAQCNLGCCYYDGEGVEQDYAKAVKWWRKAAEQGYVPAQCNLALCYANGDGVKQDEEEAVKWYIEAGLQKQKRPQSPINEKVIYNAYMKKLKECNNDKEEVEGYFLLDITQNGIPELWVITSKTDMGASGRIYSVYTFKNNDFTKIYEGSAFYSSFYEGKDCVIRTSEHGGHGYWYKITYSKGKLHEESIVDESLLDPYFSDYIGTYLHPQEPELYLVPYPLMDYHPNMIEYYNYLIDIKRSFLTK